LQIQQFTRRVSAIGRRLLCDLNLSSFERMDTCHVMLRSALREFSPSLSWVYLSVPDFKVSLLIR